MRKISKNTEKTWNKCKEKPEEDMGVEMRTYQTEIKGLKNMAGEMKNSIAVLINMIIDTEN